MPMVSNNPDSSSLGLDFRIGQLRALVASVEEGSVSGGARKLGVAQPTLTRAIKQLELSLGVPILARGPGGLELTDMGRRLLPHAKRLVRAHEKALEAAAQLAGAGDGTVNVGASALPRMLLLPPAAGRLWARFPQVQLTVVEAAFPHVLHQFESGNLDFAMCPVPIGDVPAEFEAHPILDARLAVTMRAQHPLRNCTSLSDLLDCEWIAAGPPFGQGMREAFEVNRLAAPSCRIHCESLEYALGLVARTDMVTLAPRAVVSGSVLSTMLHQPTVRDELPALSIGLIIPRRRALTPAAQHLLDALMMAAHQSSSNLQRGGL